MLYYAECAWDWISRLKCFGRSGERRTGKCQRIFSCWLEVGSERSNWLFFHVQSMNVDEWRRLNPLKCNDGQQTGNLFHKAHGDTQFSCYAGPRNSSSGCVSSFAFLFFRKRMYRSVTFSYCQINWDDHHCSLSWPRFSTALSFSFAFSWIYSEFNFEWNELNEKCTTRAI